MVYHLASIQAFARVFALIKCSLRKQINIASSLCKECIIKASNHSQNISNSETELFICSTAQLLNEKAGFLSKDIINIDLYLSTYRRNALPWLMWEFEFQNVEVA